MRKKRKQRHHFGAPQWGTMMAAGKLHLPKLGASHSHLSKTVGLLALSILIFVL